MKRVVVVSEGQALLGVVVTFVLALAIGAWAFAIAFGLFFLYLLLNYPAKILGYAMIVGLIWGVGALARNPRIALGLLGLLVVIAVVDLLRRKPR